MKHINYIYLLLIVWSLTTLTIHAQWSSIDPLPTPRAYASSAYYNGKIYVIGGVYNQNIQAYKTVEAYDPLEGTWDASLPDFPVPICNARAHVAHGTLFLLGGQSKYSGGVSYQTLYAYDVQSEEWIEKSGLPEMAVYIRASTVARDSIYIIAGNHMVSFLFAYDPVSDQWSEKQYLPFLDPLGGTVHITAMEQVGRKLFIFSRKDRYDNPQLIQVNILDLETMTWSVGATLQNDWLQFSALELDTKIFLFGTEADPVPGTWIYNPETDTWSDASQDDPVYFAGYSQAVAPDEKGRMSIYTFGSTTISFWQYGNSPYTTGLAFRYTAAKNTDWQYMAPMPTPRTMTASAVLNGKLYVIGGVTSRTGMATDIVEAYDMETDTWDTDIAPIPVPVCNAAAYAYHTFPQSNGRIFVAGGSAYYGGPGTRTLFAYDPNENTWEQKADANRTLSGHNLEWKVLDGFYAIGGIDSDGHVTDSVSVYEVENDKWLNFDPLQDARSYASSSSPIINKGLPIPVPYVFGGINDEGPLMFMERIPPDSEQSPSESQMPEKRYWHATEYGYSSSQNGVFLYGGFDESDIPSRDVFRYIYNRVDFNDGYWTKLQTELPEITSPFAPAIFWDQQEDNVCIYAIGGATPDFWTDGDGPRVTGVNLKYCLPRISTKTEETAQSDIRLDGNYPNPATGQTVISFELPGTSEVTIEITDLSGQFMGEVLNGRFEAGKHQITEDISQLPAGIYFYQLKTEYGKASRKMIVQ